jgi:PAS domain S-box-containing protein
MRDEEKTKDQLIRELQELRKQLIASKDASPEMTSDQFAAGGAKEGLSTMSPGDLTWMPDDALPVFEDSPEDVESTMHDVSVSGSFAALLSDESLHRSLTETGSFDLRWITIASFGKLMHAIPMPILLVDVSGTIEFANSAFLKLCADFHAPESFYSLFADEREAHMVEDMVKSLITRRRPQLKEGLIRIQNRELWSRMNLRSMRFGPDRTILVLIEDLTSVKREITLNEKYKTLVDIFPIGIAEFALEKPTPPDVDVDGILPLVMNARVTKGNATFATLCGLESTDELKGMTLDGILPQSHVQYHRSWIENRFAVSPFETAEKGEDGEVRYFENSLVGNIQEGVLVRFWVMKQDITERKRVEAELIEKIKTIDDLYEHIVQSREAKVIADHTAKVAHELRQPLAIIGGFVRRMLKDCAAGKIEVVCQAEGLEIIVKEVLRLEKILGRLIDFTKHESISLQSVDPNELVDYVVRINQWRIKEKNLRVELDLGEEIGELLLDSDKFQEVVRNLLSNAMEVSPPGERILISTGVSIPSEKALQTGELSSATYFELRIHNMGTPILPDALEKIFDPFFTTKETGTGLGLTLSKKIIEEHRGSVSVTSDDSGTLVTVWLPMSQPMPDRTTLSHPSTQKEDVRS